MDPAKLEAQLAAANAILAQVSPLLGGVALLVRMVAHLFSRQNISIAPFADEIARLEANTADAQAAINAFRARYPE